MENVSEYVLYGTTLKVSTVKDDELLVMEGLQYITPSVGGKVYVLESIKPKSGLLIGNEFHTGNSNLLRIDECCYCKRPE